jgi:hypothetical protein
MQHFHRAYEGSSTGPSKPDIPPDQIWRIPMKNLFLAAFAALSLSSAIVPMAHAALSRAAQDSGHTGPYDNTANSLGGRYIAGGGGE